MIVGHSKFWDYEVWVFQLCYSFLRWVWVFALSCNSIWILEFLFVQKSHLDFDSDCTDLYVDLGNNSILTISYLLTHEHAMSFHLLKSSLIFLTIFYSFQCTSLVPPWWNLFLNISILSYAIINGIVFLISFLECSYTTDFCVSVLYTLTLLNSFHKTMFYVILTSQKQTRECLKILGTISYF